MESSKKRWTDGQIGSCLNTAFYNNDIYAITESGNHASFNSETIDMSLINSVIYRNVPPGGADGKPAPSIFSAQSNQKLLPYTIPASALIADAKVGWQAVTLSKDTALDDDSYENQNSAICCPALAESCVRFLCPPNQG